MRNSLLLTFLLSSSTFTLATSQETHPQVSCEEGSGGGRCVAVEEGGKGCLSLPYTCPKQHTCCAKAVMKESLPTVKRQCNTKKNSKCFKKGGQCMTRRNARRNCQTKSVPRFCRGPRCTCCVGKKKKKKRCKTKKKGLCFRKGGKCMTKEQAQWDCHTTVLPGLCGHESCACCLPDTPTPDIPPPSPQATSAKPPPMTTTPMPVCVCGLANADRIVGGEEVMPAHKYPWIVGLLFPGRSTYQCAGSIINNMYVVTAAHCVHQSTEPFDPIQPSDVMVVIADHDQYSNTDDIPGVTMILDVTEITIQPSYDFFGVENDIALLKLSESLSFDNKAVRPVCLPRNSNDMYEGATATAAGWGNTVEDASVQPAIIMEVNVTILEPDCRGMRIAGFDITENMICAGEDEGGRDACDGDSGGPLTVTQDGRYILVGLSAFGDGCARPNIPGVYTRVNKYLDFIEQTAGGAMFCDYNPFDS
ncbi:hypothetical protein Pcinc_037069 [Petrolisthes cinctipes]|uniref:limulus clotting factor C n=1 Tax=Petrolisthes cinctipes TaxID=88211 RepID=A0AAE1BUT8_PETCI|nr:hypothetical protein Pcinc_037069 [Petrolisthes cinctipes]